MKTSQAGFLNCRQGMTVIEILVAVALLGIVSLAMMSLLENLFKSQKGLSEKTESSQAKILLQKMLENPDYCSCLFRGNSPPVRTFDTTTDSWTPSFNNAPIPAGFTQPIPLLVTSACVVTGGNLIPTVGSKMPGSQMVIDSIDLKNIIPIGSGAYSAEFSVGFKAESVAHALKNLKVPVVFNVDPTAGVATARPFVSCGGASGGPAPDIQKGTAKIFGGNTNVICQTITFPTPFPNNTYQVFLLPMQSDYGSNSADITLMYQNKLTTSFDACFDHIGKKLTNDFFVDWIAFK